MPATSRHLDIVPEPEDEDAQARAELRAALLAAQTEEIATVTIPRIIVPLQDANGRFVRDADGQLQHGPLVLYFRRLPPEMMSKLTEEATRRTPIRRGGTMTYEEKRDEVAFGNAWVYHSLLPWCRAVHFDDQSLWGAYVVGTGQEYMECYLTDNERGVCVEALALLQHANDAKAELLGKSSATPRTSST